MTENIQTETIRYDRGRWGEIQTLNGKNHGRWTVFRADGSKDWERFYLNDAQNGPERSWYENGQLEYEREFKDDQLHGSWRAWHRNGELKNECRFVKGERQGLSRWYTFDGAILAELTIGEDGTRHGTEVAEFMDEEGDDPARLGIARYEKGTFTGADYFDSIPEGYAIKF